VCIFHKKLYLDSRGVCGGGRLVGIFFLFYFIVFEFVLIFLIFLEIDLQGRLGHNLPLQIKSMRFQLRETETGTAPAPKNRFSTASATPFVVVAGTDIN
jgi:hypothetical protein